MLPLTRLLMTGRQKSSAAPKPPAAGYDHAAINDRLFLAMQRLGRTRVELAQHFGLDTELPLSAQRDLPSATLENFVRAASFLGVSVPWLTLGEIHNAVDEYVSAPGFQGGAASGAAGSAGNCSAVVQGTNNKTTVVVKHYHTDLNENEWDFVRRYRGLAPKDKAALWSRLFELEQ